MAHNVSKRAQILKFLANGNSVEDAVLEFEVGKSSIYRWLKLDDLKPRLNTPKHTKINMKLLEIYLINNPEYKLKDIAQEFNVSIPSVHNAIKRLKKDADVHFRLKDIL